MKCEDCGFEYDGEDTTCPRCGYVPTEDLIACVGLENPPLRNPLEEELDDFCRKASAEENGQAKIREQWQILDGKAREGNADARHVFSHVALARKEFDKAHRILRRLADAGHTLAQVDLARLHEDGAGVEPQPYEAIRLYRLAAAKGNPLALFKLAQHHAGTGLLHADPALANAVMGRLADRYPDLFQRKQGCQGGCGCDSKGPSAEEFAAKSASQMTRMVKWLVILGLVAFVAYVVWSELNP